MENSFYFEMPELEIPEIEIEIPELPEMPEIQIDL